MSDPDGGSGDLGEGSGDRCTCLGLPAPDLEAERLVPVLDDRSDLGRVRHREDEIQLVPTEVLHLLG